MAEVEQGLVDQQNGVVDHDPHQDDEAEQGQHVQGLEGGEVEHRQAGDAAGRGHGHGEQDHQGVDEALEEHRHHQIDDDDGDQKVADHGVPGDGQLIGRARDPHIHAGRQASLRQRTDDLALDHLQGLLQGELLVWDDLERDGARAVAVADLGRAGGEHHVGQRGSGDDHPIGRDDR